MADRHVSSPDELEAGYYDRVYRRGRGVQWFWHEHRFRTVEALLPAPCPRILDVGCGPGTFLGRLGWLFEYGLGVDVAAVQIEYARRTHVRPGLSFEVADVREIAGREPFDAVVGIEIIEHLRTADTQPFLRILCDLLRPGGTLVLTTPNYRSLWPVIERVVSRIGAVDYVRQHINPFTIRRLEDEVVQAGFCDVRIQTFFVLAPFAAMLSASIAGAMLRAERGLLPVLGAELVVRGQRPTSAAPATP